MGKPIDSRVVEYAYVTTVMISPNQERSTETGPVYDHYVQVSYELLDTDRVLLTTTSISHIVAGTGTKADVSAYVTAVAAALPAFVAADKLALSGYAPPP